MKILITGGLGLIGHNVTAKLEALGHQVIIADTRTTYGLIPRSELDYLMDARLKKIRTDPELIFDVDISSLDMIRLLKSRTPELVIHLASFPRQKVVNVNPQLGSQTMSQGLLNMLEGSVQSGVTRFLYVSSSMVYGDFTDNVSEDARCNPQGQYGIMKLAGEWLVRDYTRKYGIEHVILRPSAVYGPLDVEDRVISKFMLQAMRGSELKVNGPNETLDFTYVDDAAQGIVDAALSLNTTNNTYNITKSHSRSLLYAAELAVKLAGKGTIVVRDKDADFPSRGALDITKARRDFGFDPKVDVEEGFARYHHWLSTSPYWNHP